MILIGLGAGRTGTASLAQLINHQKDAVCFHELNAVAAHFSENFFPIKNTISEFAAILNGGDHKLLTLDYSKRGGVERYEYLKAMQHPKVLGDIAFYYLNYVEDIHRLNPDVRFLCLYRDKKSTVRSWIKKTMIVRCRSVWLADQLRSIITRTPFYKSYNYWQEHDGSKWKLCPVWDKTFPKFQAHSKEEAIGQYWDFYYSEAEKLAQKLPARFKIIEMTKLDSVAGQREILNFLGIPDEDIKFLDECHANKSDH